MLSNGTNAAQVALLIGMLDYSGSNVPSDRIWIV